jgi:hypothetical protein
MTITRADITIHGWQPGGLMLICTQCATTFQTKGYKVSAADDASDAHIEAHSDPRLTLGARSGQESNLRGG